MLYIVFFSGLTEEDFEKVAEFFDRAVGITESIFKSTGESLILKKLIRQMLSMTAYDSLLLFLTRIYYIYDLVLYIQYIFSHSIFCFLDLL